MALEDIVMMENDPMEPVTEIPLGTLNSPKDQLSDTSVNELTLVFEASYSS